MFVSPLVMRRVSGDSDSVIGPQFLICSWHIPDTFSKIPDMFLTCSWLCVLMGLEWDSWYMHIHDPRPIPEKASPWVGFNPSASQAETMRERLLIFNLQKLLRMEALRWPANRSEIILGTWIWVECPLHPRMSTIFWCIWSWRTWKVFHIVEICKGRIPASMTRHQNPNPGLKPWI